MNIKNELENLPEKPGIYLMKNLKREIIYIGKAKNLKKRMRSYFSGLKSHNKKTMELVTNIENFDYIVTSSEVEALILECNLIKKHYPKYNIALKDNKGYPYIKITNEEVAKIFITRDYEKDGGQYFGPYVSVYAIQEVMELIEDIWKPRSCNKNLPRDINKTRVCLNYNIKKCSGICNKKISLRDYKKNINNIIIFLKGDNKELIKTLEIEMKNLSRLLKFEEAISIRNKINSINKISEKQIVEKDSEKNSDIIGIATQNNKTMVQIFHIRKGQMLGRNKYTFENKISIDKKEIIRDFITQYYSDLTFIPKEIIVGYELEDDAVEEWLSKLKGSKINISKPIKGEKVRLLKMANQNAEINLTQFGNNILKDKKRTKGAIKEIQEILKIEKELKRIEAYDISNVQGFESVGSMIVFFEGKPKREDYRKFKIKTVIGADDYKSLYEVITRRFSRYKKEVEENITTGKFNKLPDLILVDGGKGQVSSVLKALSDLNLYIEVAGMIKDDKHRTKGIIYKNTIYNIKKSTEGFKILTRIQDEVHRFAIEYHRKLRTKTMTTSKLDEIKGIGNSRRNNLLKHFKNIENIKNASIENLLEVKTINKKVAKEIYYYFNDDLLK